MPEEQILSPQTTGDLIGRAVRVYRCNIRQWAPILIWPTVCVLVGRVINQYCFVTMQKGAGLEALLASSGLTVGFIVYLIGKWFLFQKQLSFVRLTTGFSSSLDDALVFLKSKRWSMVGLMLMGIFMLSAVIVLWMLEVVASAVMIKILPIPGILAILFGLLGMLVSTLFIWFAMGLSMSALACENGGATEALSRGFTMASKYFFRTMICGVIVYCTVNFIATPLWLPVVAGGIFDYLRTGPISGTTQSVPLHWQIFVAAYESLVEMVTQPIMCLAYGFYYYDLRLRNEGVDVIESLETLKLKQNELLDIR